MRKLRLFFFGRLFWYAAVLIGFAALAVCLPIFLPAALPALAVFSWAAALAAAFILFAFPAAPEYRTAWLVLILALPLLGAIAYMVWGNYKFAARIRKKHLFPSETRTWQGDGYADRTMRECASLAREVSAPVHALTADYYPDGEWLSPLLADMAAAKRFLWLEFYIAAQGEFLDSVLSVLKERTAAGVDVRFLYDDFGCASALPRDFAERLGACGIRACAFNPMHAFRFSALNSRDHRKLAVIDGECAYTGGFNLADEYIGRKIRFGHWKDAAVRVTGAPAAQFARMFARQWAYRHPNDFSADEAAIPDSAKGEIPCLAFCDDPFLPERSVGAGIYSSLFATAYERIYLFTPYLMPDARLSSALKTAAKAGKDVRVLIPHIPDKRAAFVLTRFFARELEKNGIAVREYYPGFLHAKTCVCDGKYAAVGSYNLDFRSLYLQYECGVLVDDKAFAAALERDFLSAWELGVPVGKNTKTEAALCALLRPFVPLF